MKRVLIVDDDFCILQVTKTILEHSGFITLSTDNGPGALTLLQAYDVNVLLTDLIMPGMSGSELIEEARKQHPDLPVCCMTAYMPLVNTKLDRVLIIAKPFAPGELIKAVRQTLEALEQRSYQVGASSSGSTAVPENEIQKHTSPKLDFREFRISR